MGNYGRKLKALLHHQLMAQTIKLKNIEKSYSILMMVTSIKQ